MSNKSTIPNLPMPLETVERRIYLIRGKKVMLDSDLAELYQVNTKRLNEAVKRNINRFPADFMFQLSKAEAETLRSNFVISNLRSQFATSSYGGRRYLPNAFTEHGVAMLSSVLNSPHAIQMNIFIIRAFVKLRELLASHQDLANKMQNLERRQMRHGVKIDVIYKIVQKLISQDVKPKNKIGFREKEIL